MSRTLAKALLMRDDKILLLKRSKTDARRPLQWDFAGGSVDAGESLEAACVREIQEEAGLHVNASELKLLYAHTEYDADYGNIIWLTFSVPAGEGEIQLSPEHCEYAWVTLEKALKMVTYHRQKLFLEHIAKHNLLK